MALDGVNTIFCSGTTDEMCRKFLEEQGILVIEGVNQTDLRLMAQLSGAPNEQLNCIELYDNKFICEAGAFSYQQMCGEHLVCLEKTAKR